MTHLEDVLQFYNSGEIGGESGEFWKFINQSPRVAYGGGDQEEMEKKEIYSLQGGTDGRIAGAYL